MKQVVGKLGTACQSRHMTGFKYDKVPERPVALIVTCLSCSKSAYTFSIIFINFESLPKNRWHHFYYPRCISIRPYPKTSTFVQHLLSKNIDDLDDATFNDWNQSSTWRNQRRTIYNHNQVVPNRKGIPSRELTYPTWGKGKSSSNMPYQGDMLIPWRVPFFLPVHPCQKNQCLIPRKSKAIKAESSPASWWLNQPFWKISVKFFFLHSKARESFERYSQTFRMRVKLIETMPHQQPNENKRWLKLKMFQRQEPPQNQKGNFQSLRAWVFPLKNSTAIFLRVFTWQIGKPDWMMPAGKVLPLDLAFGVTFPGTIHKLSLDAWFTHLRSNVATSAGEQATSNLKPESQKIYASSMNEVWNCSHECHSSCEKKSKAACQSAILIEAYDFSWVSLATWDFQTSEGGTFQNHLGSTFSKKCVGCSQVSSLGWITSDDGRDSGRISFSWGSSSHETAIFELTNASHRCHFPMASDWLSSDILLLR